MRPFESKLLVVRDGVPKAMAPTDFDGCVSEAELEQWIVDCPSLVGEELLVLGHQLAEFAEDRDRLDVLAVDRDGEIVLIELKVSHDFRVTDLQALGYAGAYAKLTSREFVKTLARHLQRTDPSATVDQAKDRLVEFIGLESFDDWEPSQHIRIKLVAPRFPRRVLQTVKWLGDVYAMRIEAITASLFDDGNGGFSIALERLLPVASDAEFDMTIRDREERKQQQNRSRLPPVLNALLAHGAIDHGQTLYVAPEALFADDRSRWDPEDPMFQVVVHDPEPGARRPSVRWRPSADQPYEELRPSLLASRLYHVLDPERSVGATPVAENYRIRPEGPNLREYAHDTGAWSVPESEDG